MISHHFPCQMAYWVYPMYTDRPRSMCNSQRSDLLGPHGCPIRRCSDKNKLLQLAIMHFTGEGKEPLGKVAHKNKPFSLCVKSLPSSRNKAINAKCTWMVSRCPKHKSIMGHKHFHASACRIILGECLILVVSEKISVGL